jgi:hypothetical protein
MLSAVKLANQAYELTNYAYDLENILLRTTYPFKIRKKFFD